MLNCIGFTVQRLPPPEAARLEPLLSNITGGFKYLREDRFVSMLLLFGLLPQFLVMPFMTMIPVFAEKVWMTGPEGVGILSAAVGMGAVLGSFYVAGRSQDMPRLRLMMLSAITFSLFLAAGPLVSRGLAVPLSLPSSSSSASSSASSSSWWCFVLLVRALSLWRLGLGVAE